VRPARSIMIRVITGPSSGVRTKLNEFHLQYYVNVDPLPPPVVSSIWGTSAASPSRTIVTGDVLFLKEQGLTQGETLSGFYITIGPFLNTGIAVPLLFQYQYSTKVNSLFDGFLPLATSSTSPSTSFSIRWSPPLLPSEKVTVYESSLGWVCLGPKANTLVIDSTTSGKYDLTGLTGRGFYDLTVSLSEDSVANKFFLKVSPHTETTTLPGLDRCTRLSAGVSYELLKTGSVISSIYFYEMA